MKGVMGGACCKYTGKIEIYLGTSSEINLNGPGICWPKVYPLKSEFVNKLIVCGASPSHPIMNISSPKNSTECTLLMGEVQL